MKVHIRYRSMLLAALAIFLLAVAAFPQTAFAGTTNGKKGEAPGLEKKEAATSSESTSLPSAGTPTAGDNPEDFSNHDATNGPGGQVCDGDPNNAPGAGGNYENTCPAGPSQNGAGDGQANGKPCAGCVGNADDKNPQGQATSGPTDHNNGYECDQKGRSANEGNNGVGYGNPAHTGCESVDVNPQCTDTASCEPEKCPDGKPVPSNGVCPVPTCPNGSPMPANGDCTPPPKCPDGSPMPANGDCTPPCVPSAQTVCGQVTPSCVVSATNTCGGGSVQGETLGRPVEVLGVQLVAAPATEAAPAVAAAPASLATTGAQVLGYARFGALLALFGLALTLVARRRRDTVTAD